MKKLTALAFVLALSLGLFAFGDAAFALGRQNRDMGGATGGAGDQDGMTGGTDMEKSTDTIDGGGATGGAADDRNMDKAKRKMQDRLDAVNRKIDKHKDHIGSMSASQKEQWDMDIKQIEDRRDSVEVMINDMNTKEDKKKVESALDDLERMVNNLDARMQRSAPAGGSYGGGTGGADTDTSTGTGGTGGADTDTSTGTGGTGGGTGGAGTEKSTDTKRMNGSTGGASAQ